VVFIRLPSGWGEMLGHTIGRSVGQGNWGTYQSKGKELPGGFTAVKGAWSVVCSTMDGSV
jgi:hypothetical protein